MQHSTAADAPQVQTLQPIDPVGSWLNEGGAALRDVAVAPLRVLIMEDDAVIAVLYGEVLADMGYEVCAIASDQAGAIAAGLRCRPDLMIVDERLDSGSGVAAVERILESLYVPHVFVTGDTARIEALRPGAVVIRKPFHEAELASAIKHALAKAAPGRADDDGDLTDQGRPPTKQ